MQVLLVFGAEFCPDDLLKTVGLCVDERGVLRNWQIGISEKNKKFIIVFFSVDLFLSRSCF